MLEQRSTPTYSSICRAVLVETQSYSAFCDVPDDFLGNGTYLAVGRLTEQVRGRGFRDVEFVQLLSFRPPRLRYVVRARIDISALCALRQAIVGMVDGAEGAARAAGSRRHLHRRAPLERDPFWSHRLALAPQS